MNEIDVTHDFIGATKILHHPPTNNRYQLKHSTSSPFLWFSFEIKCCHVWIMNIASKCFNQVRSFAMAMIPHFESILSGKLLVCSLKLWMSFKDDKTMLHAARGAWKMCIFSVFKIILIRVHSSTTVESAIHYTSVQTFVWFDSVSAWLFQPNGTRLVWLFEATLLVVNMCDNTHSRSQLE